MLMIIYSFLFLLLIRIIYIQFGLNYFYSDVRQVKSSNQTTHGQHDLYQQTEYNSSSVTVSNTYEKKTNIFIQHMDSVCFVFHLYLFLHLGFFCFCISNGIKKKTMRNKNKTFCCRQSIHH